jgi:hypothetical protein
VLFLLALLALPPIVTEIVRPHYLYMRFFSFLLPAFLTLLACGIVQIAFATVPAKWTSNSNVSLASCFCFSAAFLAMTLPGLWDIIRLPKQDYQGAADHLRPLLGKEEPIGVMGIGGEWFDSYGIHLTDVNSLKKLRALLANHPSAIIVDANMTPHPHQITLFYRWIHRVMGRPIYIFPGRCSGWKYLYFDGDSDITLYRLTTADLPPLREGIRLPPSAATHTVPTRISH